MANALTILRILLTLPFACMFFIEATWAMNVAFCVFVLAAGSDFLDGYVARRLNEESALGAALDPVADKLLVAAALFLLARAGLTGPSETIAALVILSRELLIAGLREALAATGGAKDCVVKSGGAASAALPVSRLAKWKTTAQLVAIAAIIATSPTGFLPNELRPFAGLLLIGAAILTLWTGGVYTVRAAAFLKAR